MYRVNGQCIECTDNIASTHCFAGWPVFLTAPEKLHRHFWKSSEKFPSISCGLTFLDPKTFFHSISSPITVPSSHTLQVHICDSANSRFRRSPHSLEGLTSLPPPPPPDQGTGWELISISVWRIEGCRGGVAPWRAAPEASTAATGSTPARGSEEWVNNVCQ